MQGRDYVKNYTVKEISDMLDINEETVRRWIRSKKLPAVQVSKKTGNIVSETELQKFLKSMPKYMGRALPLLALQTPVVGIAAAAAFVAGSLTIDTIDHKKKQNQTVTLITKEDLCSYLTSEISKCESEIQHKQTLIQQTKAEINELKSQIEQLNYILNNTTDGLDTNQKK